MVVQQSAAQRNQCIAVRALYATLGVACGVEVYALLDQQSPRGLTLEFSLVYTTTFVLAFTFAWLTAKRNVRICITEFSMEISHDEDAVRFAWRDVKRVRQPTLLRRQWRFDLKNTRRINLSTRYFSRKQIKQIKQFVSQVENNNALSLAAVAAGSGEQQKITHPRVVNTRGH